MQMKALSWDCATIAEKIQRAGWRDAGLEGPHPKRSPGRVPLAAVPPGVRGTLPTSEPARKRFVYYGQTGRIEKPKHLAPLVTDILGSTFLR